MKVALNTINQTKQNQLCYEEINHLHIFFQLYRSSIASHTVYAPAVERVIHKLWHPSREEINQELIHHQEVTIKQLHSQSVVR